MIFFKLPFNETLFTVNKNSDESNVTFHAFENDIMLDFPGKIVEISRQKTLENPIFSDELGNSLENFQEENKSEYLQKLLNVIDFIKNKKLSKLVISRLKLLDFGIKKNSEKVNLSQTFLNLCETYPNAFVYFFKEEQCWMGAFSELLGKYNKNTGKFETMSLAGTLPTRENWTEKELEEQKPVTSYIKTILENYSSKVEISETYDHISGNIKHLRTDFKTEIASEDLEKLISELHPTPAVCGIPKNICKKAIEDFEKYPRNFYAGYIKIETDEEIQYFVNLRCAEFFRNAALIHVGGGITALSSPEKEWTETELKSEAILKNIAL